MKVSASTIMRISELNTLYAVHYSLCCPLRWLHYICYHLQCSVSFYAGDSPLHKLDFHQLEFKRFLAHQKYSPLQNVKPGVHYPQMFIQTSTKDDRVHPYHARAMAQRLGELGNPVYFYEDDAGGHSYGADLKKIATNYALQYVYLYKQLLEPALAYRQANAQAHAAVSSATLFSFAPQRRERKEVNDVYEQVSNS